MNLVGWDATTPQTAVTMADCGTAIEELVPQQDRLLDDGRLAGTGGWRPAPVGARSSVFLVQYPGTAPAEILGHAGFYEVIWLLDDRTGGNAAEPPRQELEARSATVSTERSQAPDTASQVRREVAALCAAAKGYYFEDGVESDFSKRLVRLVGEHGETAVRALEDLILADCPHTAVAAEALRWLGLLGQGAAYRSRRRLLENALSADSAEVRDGAVLGLMFLDDSHATEALRAALGRERKPWLRECIEQAIRQLARE